MTDTDHDSWAGLPSPLVDAAWVERHLGRQDVRILDCSVVMRTTEDGGYTFTGGGPEWQQGHIPGSVFVDVLSDLADRDDPLPMMIPPATDFAAKMEALGVGDGARVVLYDRSNHAWAARVWWMLRYFGFDAAAVLDGGWQKWVAEKRPVSQSGPTPREARFEPRVRPELIASADDVRRALGSATTRIVNALSPEEFSGANSRFARRGRIPGSVNVYCQNLVSPDTYDYLPQEPLRRIFESAGALGADRTITYCGAGIAASSDALALVALGVDNVAVYDGSLAEWTADPSSPMESD
jgi:thiosulfate/3-mercaptopyruvate sulfurtransferase